MKELHPAPHAVDITKPDAFAKLEAVRKKSQAWNLLADVDAGIITQEEANLILEHMELDNHVETIKLNELNKTLG
jgi:hypothetical protein